MSVDLGSVVPGLPATLTANGWSGATVAGGLAARPAGWITGRQPHVARLMRPGEAPDDTDPTDPRVGWGLVLPARADGTVADRVGDADVEPPWRDLLAHRGPASKVLCYRADYGPLALFEPDGTAVPTGGSAQGVGPGELPRYLLLAGGPDVLPWALQYTLAPACAVGRLPLTGDALARHVEALRADPPVGAARYGAPLVWAVDHGAGDITRLMRDAVAAPVFARLQADAEMPAALFLDGRTRPEDATAERLVSALADTRPALVVTTSHGMTGPLDDATAMGRDLGSPVDHLRAPLPPATLLGAWQPDGAIWYSHACCSAGSDSPSSYAGLLEPGSPVDEVLTGVAALGATVAPLPMALLGAEKPLRAFVGHVEPTFDWTLTFPWTRTDLTAGIRTALYDRICRGEPVGYALQEVWKAIGTLRQSLADAVKVYDEKPAQAQRGLTAALFCRLTAADRAGTVVLGDPAVRLPLP